MTENDALLRAILDSPEDDAPRLVYADWLEEQGDPERAEFIRLQVALAALQPADPGAAELRRRCNELLAGPGRRGRWAPRLPRGVGHPEFRRGFVEEVRCRAEDFLRHADRLFALLPLRHLNVGETGPS